MRSNVGLSSTFFLLIRGVSILVSVDINSEFGSYTSGLVRTFEGVHATVESRGPPS